MFYKSRPELIKMVEDLHKSYSLLAVRGGFSCHAMCRNEIGWNVNWTFEGTGVEPKIQPKAQK